jgi:hypothetical protein
MVTHDNTDATRLPEDAAHRLLARAVELDASRSSEVTIAQLRDAACEAGISITAFDAALDELRLAQDGDRQALASARSANKSIGAWIRGDTPAFGTDLLESPVLRNIVALAGFLGILLFLVSIDRASDVHWLVRKATDPLALALGAALAIRLRARPASILLGGLAIATGAEFVMDVMLRAPAVQGFGSHWALMIAGVAGVLLGRNFQRQPRARDSLVHSADALTDSPHDRAAPPLPNLRVNALALRPCEVIGPA